MNDIRTPALMNYILEIHCIPFHFYSVGGLNVREKIINELILSKNERLMSFARVEHEM